MVQIPSMVKIKQHLSRPVIKDISKVVSQELDQVSVDRCIKPGNVIAITAGSRGISNIPLVLRQVANYVKRCKGVPVIVSAMGSHGGGTAEGQKEVLASLGITEETIGCHVSTSSEVVQLGHTTTHRTPVFCAKEVVEADGVIVVNRIKSHTAFRAPRESGLIKMMGIGLGRAPGAKAIHAMGPAEIGQIILELSRVVLEKTNVLAGLAIIENGYEETALLKGILPEHFEKEEAILLKYAKELMPRIPFESLDLLIVDEMGKDYSGTGMDTNVIGRWRIHGVPEPQSPMFNRIAVLDLSEKSHGNATGIGLADLTTKKLVGKIDFHTTYLNCLTTGFVQRAMIPITLNTDLEIFETALEYLNLMGRGLPRVAWISNTLQLEQMYCSETLIPEIESNRNLEIVQGLHHVQFDHLNNLIRA